LRAATAIRSGGSRGRMPVCHRPNKNPAGHVRRYHGNNVGNGSPFTGERKKVRSEEMPL
jgi:hypothetical protein